MTDPTQGAPVPRGPQPTDPTSQSLRTLAIVCYVLFLVAIVNGLTAIAGVVLASLKKGDAQGTIWRSHFENLIVVFWVVLIFAIVWLASFPVSFWMFWTHSFVWPWVPVLGVPFAIRLVAFPLVVVWYLYRLIRGLVRASEDRAY
jgi:uncharacterized membrane protein